MDGNKDEAQKCFKIGQEALKLGNRTRALKFLTKAHRLDPNLAVQDLISSLQSQPSDPPPSNSAPPSETSSVRHRPDSSSNSSVYTEEQISIVRQIKRQKDYYEILGVERTCSAEDVRKAYRKLSLKVHPDKNKAPGAEEAFKSVSKAFQCLSNEESKKHYDLVGSEEEIVRERPHRGHYQQGFNGFYEAEFDADEIFRNFFFGGMPRGAGTTTQFNGFSFRTGGGPSVRTEHGGGGFNVRALVQLLPILLVILLNFLPSSEPVYSFTKSYPYEYHFTTERGVNYYVRTGKFDEQYPPDSAGRERLERQVEREYFSLLAQNCRVEMQRYQWGLIRETPHCEMLKQFEAAG